MGVVPIAFPRGDRGILLALASALGLAPTGPMLTCWMAVKTNDVAAVCSGTNDHGAAVLVLAVRLVAGRLVVNTAELNRLALDAGRRCKTPLGRCLVLQRG